MIIPRCVQFLPVAHVSSFGQRDVFCEEFKIYEWNCGGGLVMGLLGVISFVGFLLRVCLVFIFQFKIR